MVTSANSKSKSNNKDKDIEPIIITLNNSINDYFTKAPQKTLWSENILNQLKGASSEYAQDYLNKIDPVSERQLKAIFPNASPTQMEDPLSTVTKTRLHDNIRRDPSTQRGLFFIVSFLLGKEITPAFEVNRKFATNERRDAELNAIQNNPAYLDILEEIMNRDDEVDLHTRLAELCFSAEAFGRAAQIIKYNRKGFPCKLIPLASTRLGHVWVDRKTWDFLGVEYLDYPTENRILLAKDILYYTVNDFHISPNSRYFGMSSIESTMAIAERNRSANEKSIPEIIEKMWAPLMILKLMNVRSADKIGEIINKLQPGKIIGMNSEVELQAVELKHDLTKVVEAVLEGSRDIYRGLTIPQTIAFQDETNRATSEGQMIQWYESVLEFKRNMLNNMLWRQWYKPQLEKVFEDRDMSRAADDGSVLEYLETRAKTITAMEENGETYQQPIPFKIKSEFANVRTTGFLDTASALLQFGDRGYLEPYMVREEAGMGRWNNDMKAIEVKNAMFMERQFGNAPAVFDENGNQINNPIGNNMNPFNQQQQEEDQNIQGQNNKNKNPPPFKPRGKGSLKFGNMKGSRLPTRQSSE